MTLDGHTTKKQVNHKWKNIHVHVIIGWEHEQTLNLFGAIIISLGGGGRWQVPHIKYCSQWLCVILLQQDVVYH